jgi:hypothetical protein
LSRGGWQALQDEGVRLRHDVVDARLPAEPDAVSDYVQHPVRQGPETSVGERCPDRAAQHGGGVHFPAQTAARVKMSAETDPGAGLP